MAAPAASRRFSFLILVAAVTYLVVLPGACVRLPGSWLDRIIGIAQ